MLWNTTVGRMILTRITNEFPVELIVLHNFEHVLITLPGVMRNEDVFVVGGEFYQGRAARTRGEVALSIGTYFQRIVKTQSCTDLNNVHPQLQYAKNEDSNRI